MIHDYLIQYLICEPKSHTIDRRRWRQRGGDQSRREFLIRSENVCMSPLKSVGDNAASRQVSKVSNSDHSYISKVLVAREYL